ncbi:hypothetical protein [Winogradskyella sp.]|uniref:hypothetical protein n=1 Tax=Winogradskyella sp. TaxID=1883156 RepID=UPI002622EF7C|nr:hypothetical protein [Winogradskyella sp.]
MKRTVYLCFLALVAFSCSTSDHNQDHQDPSSNFYALTVGNQWVYKNYQYNATTQTYEDTGVIDSVSIVSTEVLNNKTYYKFRRWTTGNEAGIAFCNPNGEHFELLRDSLGYLVKDNGRIKYTNNHFTARVLTTSDWGTVYDQLIALDNEITVEAGSFISTYSQRYAILNNGSQSPGLDHIYYADGYGLIYNTSSFVSEDIPSIVRRLDSYLVEE